MRSRKKFLNHHKRRDEVQTQLDNDQGCDPFTNKEKSKECHHFDHVKDPVQDIVNGMKGVEAQATEHFICDSPSNPQDEFLKPNQATLKPAKNCSNTQKTQNPTTVSDDCELVGIDTSVKVRLEERNVSSFAPIIHSLKRDNKRVLGFKSSDFAEQTLNEQT